MDTPSLEKFANKQEAVRTWIEKVVGIPIEVNSFWTTMKYGEILCLLMLEIKEKSVPTIHSNTKLSFLMKENIHFFITACKEIGIPKEKLFDVGDLSEDLNLEKVLDCLESVGLKCNELGEKVIYNPIPIKEEPSHLLLRSIEKKQSKRQSIIVNKSLARQSIALLNLDDVVKEPVHSKSAPHIKISPRRAPPPPPQNPEAMNNALIQLVSAIRGRLSRNRYMRQVTDEAYRLMLVNELFETEKDYVDNLKIIVEQFFKPLLENANSIKPMISVEEVKSIFSSIDIIKAYNEQLLEEIRPRVSIWSPTQRVGDIFLKMAAFLKVYTNYVSNYSNAINVLGKCRRKEKVDHFLEEHEMRESSRNHTLVSLLIMPVQRVPRYYMLLQEIRKRTWENHADYKDIVESECMMEKVVSYINEKTRDFENVHKVTEIQEKFQGISEDLALPHRRFVRDFTCILNLNVKVKAMRLYIFNDLIVLTKSHKPKIGKSKKAKEKVVDCLRIATIMINSVSDKSLEISSEGEILHVIEFFQKKAKDEVMLVLDRLKEELSEKFSSPSDERRIELKKTSKKNLNPFAFIKGVLTNDDKKEGEEKRKSKLNESKVNSPSKAESSSEEQSTEEESRPKRHLKHSKSMKELKSKNELYKRERNHTKGLSSSNKFFSEDV